MAGDLARVLESRFLQRERFPFVLDARRDHLAEHERVIARRERSDDATLDPA